MCEILETERLVLREFRKSDATNLFELNADPDVIRYTGDTPFRSVSEVKEFLSKYPDYKQNGFGRWAVVLKEHGRFIGWCGLKLNEESFVDIGFRFFKCEWNKGFATEAAKATLHYGFSTLNMESIIGRASKDNKPSIRVLEKLNMPFWKFDTCEGIKHAAYYRIHKTQYQC